MKFYHIQSRFGITITTANLAMQPKIISKSQQDIGGLTHWGGPYDHCAPPPRGPPPNHAKTSGKRDSRTLSRSTPVVLACHTFSSMHPYWSRVTLSLRVLTAGMQAYIRRRIIVSSHKLMMN